MESSRLPSEPQLHGDLHEAGCVRDVHNPKPGGRESAARILELGMIEDIEGLKPDLENFRFGEADVFPQCHIIVVYAWPVEKPPVSIADHTNRLTTRTSCVWAAFRDEQRSIEVRIDYVSIGVELLGSRIGVGKNATRKDIRLIHVPTKPTRADQRLIGRIR